MSYSSHSDDEENRERPTRELPHRVARKSTTNPSQSSTMATSISTKSTYMTRRLNAGNPNNLAKDRFIENFNPEMSIRERRKLNRKFNSAYHSNSNVRRPPGALYDENGVHLATGLDLCDCLNEECSGCFFPCPKCGSQKCGIDCRVHRKFIYDQIEYHGYDIVVKNPISKRFH